MESQGRGVSAARTAVASQRNALLLRFVPGELQRASTDTLRRAKFLVGLCIAVGAWGPVFALLYWSLGLRVLAAGNALATLGAAAPLLTLAWTGSLVVAGNLAAADLAWILVLDAALQGGLRAPAVTWFGAVPAIAVLVAGGRSGAAWGGVMAGAVAALFGLDRLGVLPAPPLAADTFSLVRLTAVGGSVLVSSSLAFLYESLKNEALESLETTNRQLAAARDDAEAGARTKSAFLATMSHEIRTPMTVILGHADLLADPATPEPERTHSVERIRRHGGHLLRIINDILDLSKIEAGKMAVELALCSPTELVDEVASLLRTQAIQRGLTFDVEYRGPLPERVRTDPTRVRQILLNLV